MQRTPNCPNCFRNFSFKEICKTKQVHIPLLLGCGHTFCDNCLIKLARLQKTEIICPECKQPTPLGTEGEAGVRELEPNVCVMGVLSSNFYKRSLIERTPTKSGSVKGRVSSKDGMKQAVAQIAQKKKAEELAKSAGLKCEECFRVAATSRCNKCECVFCAICFEKVHSSSHTLRKHKPFPITKTSAEPEAGCPDHKNRPFEFFDKAENQPVCSHCVVVGERQGHHIVPITDVVDELKEGFKSSFEHGQNIVKQLERSQRKVCQTVSEVMSEKTQTVIEIREHFHYLCALLQLRERALVKEVETHHGQEEQLETTITEQIKKSRSVLQELEEVILVPTKLISKSKELMDQFKSLKDMPCVAVKSAGTHQEPKFSYDKSFVDSLSSYGNVKDAGDIKLELKNLSEVEDGDLVEDTSDEEPAQEAEQDVRPEEDPVEMPVSTPRSITAAKLLNIPFRHELVQVTHIRDPCHFMVQRQADLEQVNAMMNAIQHYCEATDADDLVFEVNVGDMVCAQFSVDNLWYRARVMTIFSDKNPSIQPTIENGQCIEVIYMDFGNTEWVPLMRLRKMLSQFLEVPDLAVNCSLMDIVPPFQEEKWPPKAVKAFGSLTGDKPLLMTVLRRRGGGKLYIDLKSPDNDEPMHDDDRPASVRDALVFLEVARFTSPASAPEGRAMFPMRSYKEPVLVQEGEFADAIVTHVTGPDEIYVQKLRSEEMKELTHIMNEMMKMYAVRKRPTEASRVIWPYRGLVCAARFSEDKVWYRALVTAVYSDETVDVTYVDYGNFERVSFSEIRKLPDTFLKLPRQAIPCYLEDVKPAGDDAAWTDAVRDYTCNLLLNKSLVVEVKNIKNGTMAVSLHDTSTENDVCINTFLVMAGKAQSCGLGVVSMPDDEAPQRDVPDAGVEEKTEEDVVVENQASEEQLSERDEKTSEAPSEEGESADVKVEQEEVPTEEKTPSVTQEPEVALHKPETVTPKPEIMLPKSDVALPKPEFELPKPEFALSKPEVALPKPEVALPKPEVALPKAGVRRVRSNAVDYKPFELPWKRQFQAGVTYVGFDGCIYAQEMKDGDQTLIDVMKGLMALYSDNQNSSSAPSSLQDVFIGQPCAAQFADDGMWYRASVTGILRARNCVEVNYVDFGNSEVVPLSALRMEMPYLDVPRQCLHLSLYGVGPGTPDGSWSKESISALNNMIVGKDCTALKEGDPLPGRPLEVRLCLPEGINVTESLVAKGLVRPLSGAPKVKHPAGQGLPAEVRRSPPKATKEKIQPMSRAQAQIQALLISAREADSMLSHTELPEIGVTFDVTVTHVDEPDCVFIQRYPPPDTDDLDIYDVDPSLVVAEVELERLENMAFKINEPEFFKNYDPLTTAKQGMLCCGRYTEDDTWYRAQVLSVQSENPLSLLVRYVDYGNSEVLPSSRLRGFPAELLSLPIQAIRCRLADIQPPLDSAKAAVGSQWPPETKELLVQIVAGKTLTARIVSVGPPVCILLFDRTPDDKGQPGDVSIGKMLSNQKLATYIGSDTTHTQARGHTTSSSGPDEHHSNLRQEIAPESEEPKSDNTDTKDNASDEEKRKDILLEKILNPKAGFKPSKPLLTPQEFLSPPKKVAAIFTAHTKTSPVPKPVQDLPSGVALATSAQDTPSAVAIATSAQDAPSGVHTAISGQDVFIDDAPSEVAKATTSGVAMETTDPAQPVEGDVSRESSGVTEKNMDSCVTPEDTEACSQVEGTTSEAQSDCASAPEAKDNAVESAV